MGAMIGNGPNGRMDLCLALRLLDVLYIQWGRRPSFEIRFGERGKGRKRRARKEEGQKGGGTPARGDFSPQLAGPFVVYSSPGNLAMIMLI